jgi:hypothetical protein
LIVTKEQYEFYYHELWDDLTDEVSYQEGLYQHANKVTKKVLQIFDLLALSVEM